MDNQELLDLACSIMIGAICVMLVFIWFKLCGRLPDTETIGILILAPLGLLIMIVMRTLWLGGMI